MRQADSALQNLAPLLLAHEAGGDGEPELLADAMERACERLRLHLGKLMGMDGFTLLLVRALTLARADFPWMAEIQAERDGSLKNLRAACAGREPTEAAAGFAAVLAHFFGLLVAFIGEDLAWRLIQGAWPDIDLGGKDLGREETTQ